MCVVGLFLSADDLESLSKSLYFLSSYAGCLQSQIVEPLPVSILYFQFPIKKIIQGTEITAERFKPVGVITVIIQGEIIRHLFFFTIKNLHQINSANVKLRVL